MFSVQSAAGAPTIESSLQSPFSGGSRSTRLSTGDTRRSEDLIQVFNSISDYDGLKVSFDFYVDDITFTNMNGWTFLIGRLVVAGFSAKLIADINRSGLGMLRMIGGTEVQLEVEQWYRFEAELTDGITNTFVVNGSLTEFGGNSVQFNAISSSANTHLSNYDAFQIRDASDNQAINIPLVIDNVSLTTVPEPNSLVLLGLAGSTLLIRRRRQSKIH